MADEVKPGGTAVADPPAGKSGGDVDESVADEVLDKVLDEALKDTEPSEKAGEKADGKAADPYAALPEDERVFLDTMKKTGTSLKDALGYMAAGFDAVNGARANAGGEASKKAGETKAGDDEDEEAPVTRAELRKVVQGIQQKTEIAIRGTQNQAKLASMLDDAEETRNDEDAREIVEAKVWKNVQDGKSLDEAFRLAMKGFRQFGARLNRQFIEKKIKERRSAGESGPGASAGADLPPEKYESKASDFDDGTLHKRAVAFVRKRQMAGR